MKLVILAAAIIIARAIGDPTYTQTHKLQIILVVAAFAAWDGLDYYHRLNKKQ